MGKKILILAVVVIAFYALLIATGQAKNPFSSSRVSGSRTGDDNQDGDLKCDLRGNDGRLITITGRGPEFEKLCRQQSPVMWYGYQYYPLYYYTWYYPWGWRRNPPGGHGSGAGGGTGGGNQDGTGGGTGTPS